MAHRRIGETGPAAGLQTTPRGDDRADLRRESHRFRYCAGGVVSSASASFSARVQRGDLCAARPYQFPAASCAMSRVMGSEAAGRRRAGIADRRALCAWAVADATGGSTPPRKWRIRPDRGRSDRNRRATPRSRRDNRCGRRRDDVLESSLGLSAVVIYPIL